MQSEDHKYNDASFIVPWVTGCLIFNQVSGLFNNMV